MEMESYLVAKKITELTAAGAVDGANDLVWIEQSGQPRKVAPEDLVPAGLADAPSDTRTYARKDGAWVVIATEDVLVLTGGVRPTCDRAGGISIYDLKFDNDGLVYEKCSPGSFVQIDTSADWIRPVDDAADFQMRFTNLTGTGFSSTATENIWRSMATDFVLTCADNNAGGGGNSATFTIEVRFGTGPTLASASYTISANRTS